MSWDLGVGICWRHLSWAGITRELSFVLNSVLEHSDARMELIYLQFDTLISLQHGSCYWRSSQPLGLVCLFLWNFFLTFLASLHSLHPQPVVLSSGGHYLFERRWIPLDLLHLDGGNSLSELNGHQFWVFNSVFCPEWL